MNSTDIASLCPYTGLRSFTEEESIYFKGRDAQIDQITAQLSERKFLMLTGASGDGKSSLIYAGLVPQARSGFFKAKFPNWTVIDFRPERAPLMNLIKAVSSAFQAEPASIETELSRGFSSLVDLYLNSEFYPDYSANSNGEAADARLQLRKSSNLMVIVDQFEEFFTNPENNEGDVPNQSSQTVVNVMLETARIALERALPIYVVFTMRSDYIGQCSAFRGLPEFIGYSQFFVPRLTRGELKQVIEEPALLNGNTITRRLSERLIYDLNEGIDQLPILQHALSQIWRMASNGTEEMDLIHYSMAGGLAAGELPPNDQPRFKAWLETLPENQRTLYTDPGLDKVIEIHARKLYDGAASHYASIENTVALPTRTLKNCIAITFACLTRIDNGRAVRNRMSLSEISQVINQAEITPVVLGRILEIFRLPDNSFIRPFVFEGNRTDSPDTVLDITHESLIRNWSMLKRWADQEYLFYTTFEDLRKQIIRWKEHHRSKGYLIPIGPLTYFENWYGECKPNAAWIRRYLDRSGNAERDQQHADALLTDINSYLRESARNVAISRLLIRYGAGKIAGFAALAAVAVLAVYFMFDIYRKKSSTVIEQVRTEGRQLLKSNEVGTLNKAAYLISEERLTPGAGLATLAAMPDVTEKLTVSYDIWRVLYASPHFHRSEFRTQLINQFDSQLRGDAYKTVPAENALQARVQFALMSSLEHYYDQDRVKRATVTDNASALFPQILDAFKSNPVDAAHTALLNQAVQLWLTFADVSPAQIDQLIQTLSPNDSSGRFHLFFKRGTLEADGYRPLDFGGGYHTLATLYAAKGDVDKVLWAFEQQLATEDYFTDRLFNTRSNVLGYLYQYGHRDLVPRVIAWHKTHFPNISEAQILVDLINRSGYLSELERVNLGFRNEQSELGSLSLNLCLSDRKQYALVLADYESALNQIKDAGEREFELAMHYKRVAMYSVRYHRERGLENKDNTDALFDKAMARFNNLSEIDQQVPVTYRFYYLFGTRTRTWTRRQLFVFPDIHGSWQAAPKHGDAFFLYLTRKNLLKEVYKNNADLSLIPFWVITMKERFRSINLSSEALQAALELVTAHPAGKGVDLNIVKIELAHSYFNSGDTAKGKAMAKQIDVPLLEASRSRYPLFESSVFLNELMALEGKLAAVGELPTTAQLTHGFPNPESKVSVYLHAAHMAKRMNHLAVAKILLDSAAHLTAQLDEPTLKPWFFYGDKFNFVASYIDDKDAAAQAEEMLRSTPENFRVFVYQARMTGLALRDDLYGALHSLPGNFTEAQDLDIRTQLLSLAATVQEGQNLSELGKMANEIYFSQRVYVFFFGQNI